MVNKRLWHQPDAAKPLLTDPCSPKTWKPELTSGPVLSLQQRAEEEGDGGEAALLKGLD